MKMTKKCMDYWRRVDRSFRGVIRLLVDCFIGAWFKITRITNRGRISKRVVIFNRIQPFPNTFARF